QRQRRARPDHIRASDGRSAEDVNRPAQGRSGITPSPRFEGIDNWRRSQGLPATGIHWGPWSQVGRGQHLAQRGFVTISPADGIDALERILAAGYHQVAYSAADLDRWIAPYPALRESTLVSEMLADGTADNADSPVRDELLTADSDTAKRQILETFIIDTVRDLLGGTARHIGRHTSMVMLGLDSLGAVQLQQRLHRTLKIALDPGVVWVKPTAAGLSDWLLHKMGHQQSDTAQELPGVPQQPPAPRGRSRHADHDHGEL
ncbi:hypothetical protein E1287_42940, partial [Actinomadura sp. KC06]|uniref:acyl carrier protein n=1 Tax=Actinomadura sp. KC06 TaxID=2530369 RepID=UPI0010450906